MLNVGIQALAASVPANVQPNNVLLDHLDTTDEWIKTRTGIHQRHLASDGVATSDLATSAVTNLARITDLSRVSALILVTTSPDSSCPATAPQVAHRAGLGNIGAFDINSACAGFVYGLTVAASLVNSASDGDVVLVCAETFSNYVNPLDRNTAPLFGDAATALLVARTANPGILSLHTGSDGSAYEILHVPDGGGRARANAGRGTPVKWGDDKYLRMDGRAVYSEAIRRMTESANIALNMANLSVAELTRFIPHQANARISQAVATRLGIPEMIVASNIAEVGNTLSASIPLLLAQEIDQQKVNSHETLLVTAFGAGLSWGSAILSLTDDIPVNVAQHTAS